MNKKIRTKISLHFYLAKNKEAIAINPVVNHFDTSTWSGKSGQKYRRHSLLTLDRSWHRSAPIPSAYKKKDSGY